MFIRYRPKHAFVNSLVFILSIIFCGLYSIYLGKELCWDSANYHYYLPFSVLHHRDTLDFFPVSFIHQFFNPALDFLSYFFINIFSPQTTEFLLGAIHGINIWLLYLIFKSILRNQISFMLIVLVGVGIYGPTVAPGIGSVTNDNLVSIFVLTFVWLQIKFFIKLSKTCELDRLSLIVSGIILGAGAGLKLTAEVFVIGAIVAVLFLPLRKMQRIKIFFFLSLGIGIGFLMTDGYWMWHLWQTHRNPFFPFFNQIFQSPDFPLINWRDKRFLPKDTMEMIFFPFYFGWDGRSSEMGFQDFRFPMIYLLCVIYVLRWFYRQVYVVQKLGSTINSAEDKLAKRWLFCFFIFSYITWQCYFSCARYLGTLEMLAPIIIYGLLSNFCENKSRLLIIAAMIFTAIFFLEIPATIVRTRWYDRAFFNIQLPSSIQNIPKGLVLIAYSAYAMNPDPRPQNYLIPYFPSNWRFVGIPFYHEKYMWDPHTHQKLLTLVQKDTQIPIFLLAPEENMPELLRVADDFGLSKKDNCEEIFTDRQTFLHQNVLLCPVLAR